MKIRLCFLLAFAATTAQAFDSTEIILPKTKIIRTTAWYAAQASRWQRSVARDRQDASAWFNYYTASRYAQYSKEQLARLVSDMNGSVPGTYEAMVATALEGGYEKDSFQLLQNAFDRFPKRANTYGPLVLFQEFNLNPGAREAFSRRLVSSGQLSESLLSYSYNVLMSLEDNAVLFTEGDNTTLPLFVLQDITGVRKDVTILNLDLLFNSDYRSRKFAASHLVFEEPGINSPVVDLKRFICSTLPSWNPGRIFYFALTVSHENIDAIKDQLYVVGLASQLSKERLNNISRIRDNIEKRFLLDYLSVDFNGESDFGSGKVLSSNYLVPMLLLHDYYREAGELEKGERLALLVSKIAGENGKSEMVNRFLRREKETPLPFVPANVNWKELEDSYRIIRDNYYMFHTEVTNQQYNIFLDHLSATGQKDAYELCKADLSSYDPASRAFFEGYHSPFYGAKSHVSRAANFSKYPVVNVTFEAATAYCEWLTEQYNNHPGRKFRKVRFRLPAIREFQIAALGYKDFTSWDLAANTIGVTISEKGDGDMSKGKRKLPVKGNEILYPWHGSTNILNKPQNRFNCFLGNFKAPADCKPCVTRTPGMDGYTMMGQVASYFPNDIGLFDVVGNVAEMTEVKGKACGGSWNHPPEESTIESVNEYAGPQADIGFRIFMEVIER